MKKFRHRVKNYVGQFRLYSLVDLVIMLYAIKAPKHIFVGAVLLWIGFLIFLEDRHHREGRERFPAGVWPATWLIGLIVFYRIEAIFFVVAAYLYSLKSKGNLGLVSPLFRGSMSFLIVGSVLGYQNKFTWIAGSVIVLRSLVGDWRDIVVDRDHGMRTIPIALGMSSGYKWLHLIAVMLTTLLWCIWGQIEVEFLLIAWLIEASTYQLTPR